MTRRKLCVVTGTRAEYGLLRPLLAEIAADPDLQLQIVATGMHLSPEFGLTYREIEADGFLIDARVELLLSSDSPVGIAKSIGLGVSGFADALMNLTPDILILLGDRFELLGAAAAAMVARIPIAHIHGGETSEGAYDEFIRHSITKMAQWHYVAAEPYRRRVIQLGEEPQRVFNFGTPGLDQPDPLRWSDREQLEEHFGMTLSQPLFLVTYHPETLGAGRPLDDMNALLAALDAFPNATVIITHPNADGGGRALVPRIEEWTAANAGRARAAVSLGRDRYLSVMRLADAVIGNSSSGLIEAPWLHRPTVNIGDRQKGRLRADSVIDCAADPPSITAAIRRAISPAFQEQVRSTQSPYGSGGASRRIRDSLKSVVLDTRKTFFDVPHAH